MRQLATAMSKTVSTTRLPARVGYGADSPTERRISRIFTRSPTRAGMMAFTPTPPQYAPKALR